MLSCNSLHSCVLPSPIPQPKQPSVKNATHACTLGRWFTEGHWGNGAQLKERNERIRRRWVQAGGALSRTLGQEWSQERKYLGLQNIQESQTKQPLLVPVSADGITPSDIFFTYRTEAFNIMPRTYWSQRRELLLWLKQVFQFLIKWLTK